MTMLNIDRGKIGNSNNKWNET